jgi:hypothetical protein
MMKTIMKTTIKTMLFLGSLFFLGNSYALGVSPLVIQSDATNEGVSGVITVTNAESTEQEAKLYSMPFTYSDKGFEALKSSPNDLSSYLVFSPKSVTLKPNESRQIRFNARFLPSTAAGEYRAMVFVEQAVAEKSASSATSIIPRIGSAIYVRVGGVKAELAVQSASYKDKKVLLAITNAGKASARPRMEWTLEQAGKTVATNAAHKTAFDAITVIAEGKRTIELNDDELSKLAAGNYQLIGTLFWGEHDENTLKFDQSFVVGH